MLAPNSADYFLFFGAVAIGAAVALMPLFVALAVGHYSGLPRRYVFAVLCTILVYGLTTVVALVQGLFEAASSYLAPTWSEQGHHFIANSIAYAAEYLGYGMVIAAVAFAIGIPLWLRRSWSALVTAVGANKSFKPNPLRGSA